MPRSTGEGRLRPLRAGGKGVHVCVWKLRSPAMQKSRTCSQTHPRLPPSSQCRQIQQPLLKTTAYLRLLGLGWLWLALPLRTPSLLTHLCQAVLQLQPDVFRVSSGKMLRVFESSHWHCQYCSSPVLLYSFQLVRNPTSSLFQRSPIENAPANKQRGKRQPALHPQWNSSYATERKKSIVNVKPPFLTA